MNTIEKAAIAERVFKDIKDALVKSKKEPKQYWQASGGRTDISVDNWYDNKAGKYIKQIRVGRDKGFNLDATDYEIKQIMGSVMSKLEVQKQVRGWKNLVYTTRLYGDNARWGSGWECLDKVSVLDDPCSEFKSIQTFLKKYGGYNLPDYLLFSSAMGGKRGRLWDEYGDRYYLANKQKKCADILDALRKSRGTNDTVYCKYGEEDYIDPVDRIYSERYEIECEGEKRHYLEVTIKTPTGRVKYQQKLY